MKYVLNTFLLVIVTIALTGCFSQKNTTSTINDVKDDSTDPIIDSKQEVAISSFTESATFIELIRLGKTSQCDFNHIKDGSVLSGTSWIDAQNNSMTIELALTKNSNQPTTINMIIKDGINHMWNDSSPTGVKLVQTSDGIFGGLPLAASEGSSLSDTDIIDFNCKQWSVNPDVFQLPENIDFLDMTSQINQVLQFAETIPGEEGESDKINISCDVCSLVNEDEQAKCRVIFGC